MNSGKTLIGIGGGHLSSQIIAYNRDWNEPKFANGKQLNRHYLPAKVWKDRLYRLARRLFLQVEDKYLQEGVLTISLPGAAEDVERVRTHQLVADLFPNFEVNVLDDTWALSSLAQKLPCLTVIADVGASVSFVQNTGSFSSRFKIDGMGVIIGDFGGAFELVALYLQNLGRTIDQRRPCPIFEKLLEFSEKELDFRLPDAKSIQTWLSTIFSVSPFDWRSTFASLAFPILEYAGEIDRSKVDDRITGILDQSVKNMLHSIEIAMEVVRAEELKLDTVVCSGLMFTKSPYFSNRISEGVKEKFNLDVVVSAHHEAVGALLHSCNFESRMDFFDAIQSKLPRT